MSLASTLLESSRRARGVSQRALARAAGASQAGIVDIAHGRKDATLERLDGLLRHLDYQVALLPTRRAGTAAVSEEVRAQLDQGRPEAALRAVWQLAANLQAVDPALRVALCVAAPAPTGDERFDALIAGVVDHLLSDAGLPRPVWLDEPSRFLAEPWDVEPVPALQAAARASTPDRLAAHGVYLDAAELVNA